MSEEKYVVDLTTGERISPPEEYREGLAFPGERLGPDHIEALRKAGESEEVLSLLQSHGSVASYQAGPGAPIILPDDPKFPHHLLEEHEERRTSRQISGPPNVITGDYWPFCENGKPKGFQWNPPGFYGYNGAYYVRGTYGNIYMWKCGAYMGGSRGNATSWVCNGYHWINNDYYNSAAHKVNLAKLAKYSCLR